MLGISLLFAFAVAAGAGPGAADQSDGRAVQQAASGIEIVRVSSPYVVEMAMASPMFGSVSFNDCVSFIDRAAAPVKHVQFVFAAVDLNGRPKRPLLPLDLNYIANPGALHDENVNCRDHVYANGDRGLWLVAWANVVDFADGTSWHAPPSEALAPLIRASLPQ